MGNENCSSCDQRERNWKAHNILVPGSILISGNHFPSNERVIAFLHIYVRRWLSPSDVIVFPAFSFQQDREIGHAIRELNIPYVKFSFEVLDDSGDMPKVGSAMI